MLSALAISLLLPFWLFGVLCMVQGMGGNDSPQRLLRLALTDCMPDGGQPRKDFSDGEGLTASLARHGQQVPVIVRPAGETGKYIIVDGERRWRCAPAAGLTHLWAILSDQPMDDMMRLEIQLATACTRKGLTPLEEGMAYLRAMEMHGWTAKRLAVEWKLSEATVCRKLKTLRLAPEVLARLLAGEITETEAVATVSKHRAAKPKPVTFRAGKGLRLTVSGGLTVDAVESCLTEALKAARSNRAAGVVDVSKIFARVKE